MDALKTAKDTQNFIGGIQHDISLFLRNHGVEEMEAYKIAKNAAQLLEQPIYEAITK